MNRRLSALDRFALVSNSDAHSPSKIGREANVFDTDFSFRGLIDALRKNDPARFLYTVEFFPEEGKYHYDGHRKCGVVCSPRESRTTNDLCPKCGKPLTIGVLHRVEELADRETDEGRPGRVPHKNLIPLNEIIAEALGKTSECQGVWESYFRFIREFGDEHAHPDRGPRRRPGPRRAGARRRGRRPDAPRPRPHRARGTTANTARSASSAATRRPSPAPPSSASSDRRFDKPSPRTLY